MTRLMAGSLFVAAIGLGACGSEDGLADTLSRAATKTCTTENFAVKADDLLPETYTIAGELCGNDPADRKTLLITAHGATYNHLYWNWPQSPETYSFVQSQDVPVLNIDLLGSGASSQPLSLLVTMQSQAFVMHQVVQAMRTRGFENIVLIGHSSGSGMITLEASTYHDVDGVIVTGFLHQFSLGLLAVPFSLYPAALDPAFAGMLDAGYLTTRPGARSNDGFYYAPTVDPDVIVYDDAHKDVVATPYAIGFPLIISDPSISQAVDVPVLSLVGQYDPFCDGAHCPSAADEPTAWSPSAQLELHVIPDAGHNIHLHAIAAEIEYAHVREWLDRRF